MLLSFVLTIPKAFLRIIRNLLRFLRWTAKCLIEEPIQTIAVLVIFGLVGFALWHAFSGVVLWFVGLLWGLLWPPSLVNYLTAIGLVIFVFFLYVGFILHNIGRSS